MSFAFFIWDDASRASPLVKILVFLALFELRRFCSRFANCLNRVMIVWNRGGGVVREGWGDGVVLRG